MRILILGGSGMIGHKIYQVLRPTFPDTWVLFRKSFFALEISVQKIFNEKKVIDNFDLIDFQKLQSLLLEINPHIIINAAGITIRRGINDDLGRSIIINSALPHFLENWVTGKKEKKLIHFSTDCVFSGNGSKYTENNFPDAQDYYGKTKALGEVSGNQALTLRGSMIGQELENHTELLEWLLSQKDKRIKGFSNVIYSGITTIQMAIYVEQIVKNFPSLTGLYQISSNPISKYDLLCLINETFGIGATIEEEKNYFSNKHLSSEKFFNITGFNSPKWDSLILELKKDSDQNKNLYKR